MDPEENHVLSVPFAPVLWIAISTPLIFLSILGAGYSNILGEGTVVSGAVILIGIPSLCVSIVQYFLLKPARPPVWRWMIASAGGTAMGLVMGWVAVMGFAAILDNSGTELPLRSDNLAAAILGGGICGMIGGVVTGVIASLGQWVALRLDRQMTSAWMGANVASWGVGLAALGAFIFGILSQLTFSF